VKASSSLRPDRGAVVQAIDFAQIIFESGVEYPTFAATCRSRIAKRHYSGTLSLTLRLRVGRSHSAGFPEDAMRFCTRRTLAVAAAVGLLAGTAVRAQAAEVGFLEMLFGARPAPQQAAPAAQPPAFDRGAFGRRSTARLGAARRHFQTRYAALPVRIRVKEPEISPRQIPIDMKAGAAAALLKDETLRPGDVVVLSGGARVFTGDSGKRHAMRDFEPVQTSAHVGKGTRKVLAGLFTPVGALPSGEARRLMARSRIAVPIAATPIPEQKTAMRVINPWQVSQ
jgi:hypothetical protein